MSDDTSWGMRPENWNDDQWATYDAKCQFVKATLCAFTTVFTQYCASEWIWFGNSNTKRPPHKSPVYLLSFVVFWAIWSMMLDYLLAVYDPLPLGFFIAAPILSLAGVPLNLLFCWIWSKTVPSSITEAMEETITGRVLAESKATKVASRHVSSQDLWMGNINNASEDIGVDKETLGDKCEKGEERQRNDKEGNEESESDIVEAIIKQGDFKQEDFEQGDFEEKKPKEEKSNIPYINNIKIFLTNLVILHHVGGLIGMEDMKAYPQIVSPAGYAETASRLLLGFNRTFFMSLFFFFSGYFVPKSFDKKGRHDFLVSRGIRLGIPFVLSGFFINPYVQDGFFHLFFSQGAESYPRELFDPGVTWFLQQLILFNVVYAFLCGEGWSPRIGCPTFGALFIVAMALGVVIGLLVLVFPNTIYVDDPLAGSWVTPLFWLMYPSYVVFFFGGALAERNNWMEEMKNKPPFVIYMWAGVSVFCYCLGDIMNANTMMGSDTETNTPTATMEGDIVFPDWLVTFCVGLVYANMGISLSLSLTVLFMERFNKSYFCTNFFTKAMYTAYIIQKAFPIPVAVKLWLLVLQATGNVEYIISDNNYELSNPNWQIPAGFFFASIIALVIIWPMAYAICSIPGFNRVL